MTYAFLPSVLGIAPGSGTNQFSWMTEAMMDDRDANGFAV